MEQYLSSSPVRTRDTVAGSAKGSPTSGSPRSVQDFLGLSRQDPVHPLALSTSLISQYAPQLASLGELQELRGAVSRLTADLDATRRERDVTVRSLSNEITHLKFLLQRNESEHLVSAPRMAVALAEAREEGYRKGHQASAAEASQSLGDMGAALREFSERATSDAMNILHTRQALEAANQRVAASEAKALEAEKRCEALLLSGGAADTPQIQHLAIVVPAGGGVEGSSGGDTPLSLPATAPSPSMPNSPSTPVTSPKRTRGGTDATPTAFPPTPIRTREEPIPMAPTTPNATPAAARTYVVVGATVPASTAHLTPVAPSSLQAASPTVKKDKVEEVVPVMAPPAAAAAAGTAPAVVAAAAEVVMVEPTAMLSGVAEVKAEVAPPAPPEPPMSAAPPPSAPPAPPVVAGSDPSSSSSSSQWHPLETLVKLPYPAGVEKTKRESYLSPQDFLSALGMDKEAFSKLPKWKQDGIKKKAGLY
jgi:hypothetical protein